MRGPGDELEDRIRSTGLRMAEALRGRYASILVVGGAARGESTFDADGRLLSDVDFFIVLPQRRVLSAWWAARDCRRALRAALPWIESADWLTTGYAQRTPRFWRAASPLMLELKANARVLSGIEEVRGWPAIRRGGQIPRWEGLRLVGNRLCEFLGSLGSLSADSVPAASGRERTMLAYRCVKLVLACSECCLIDARRYRPSYRERMKEQSLVPCGSAADAQFITDAYRAKLNCHPDFWNRPIDELVEDALRLALSVLAGSGVRAPGDWERLARSVNPGTPGWMSDAWFFAGQILRGRRVPFRRPIAAVYRDAHALALDFLDGFGKAPKAACRIIGVRFAGTPQFAGQLPRAEGNG